MEITVLQLLGLFLVVFAAYCFYKGKIQWSLEVGPGATSHSMFHVDLTPDKYKLRKEGVIGGKWVRPVCAVITIVGLLLIFKFSGDTVVIEL